MKIFINADASTFGDLLHYKNSKAATILQISESPELEKWETRNEQPLNLLVILHLFL